ncbi:alanine--tRNA ligase [Candidatus Uhrbacteria bacterium]|nr:alanine--tRNA ligase [Candidatus Uhrbacteria bacterium]
MNSNEIRQKFLDFFKKRGHAVLPSASLIPENDPTTLFTGSGMQPMVPYLLGQTHPSGKLLANSQKCFRSQDIEEVGDSRHTTFFEMLGNWSLGDYFKEQQISWMFEFLTKELGLDPKRLYVTVFRGNDTLGIPRDDRSVKLWQEVFGGADVEAKAVDFSERDGMDNGRIFYYDETKNWWSRSGVPRQMPLGEPGGPDSEMFWDFGAQLGMHERSFWKNQPCHVNCDCGRFMEIGNNVFMEYRKTADGFEKLPQQNVDFGGGLERMAAAVLDKADIFYIDLFQPIREALENISGKRYEAVAKETKAFRIIMDHLRAATFLIGDGAIPSNKDQGYVTRRLIRRAVVQKKKLKITKSFLAPLARLVISTYQGWYPKLVDRGEIIAAEFEREEEKFMKTLDAGWRELEKLTEVDGEKAFLIYQSYGFPLELIQEELAKRGLVVDEKEFKEQMLKHQELSRAGSAEKFSGGLIDHSEQVIRGHTATHLLHASLRKILGNHVRQNGSNITHERLRFDFSHPQKVSSDELEKIEAMVNEQIKNDLPVHFQIMDLEEAKRAGAMGIFEDKYAQLGGKIKVYMVGDETDGYFSKEVCGGPHVSKTGEIKSFKILKEEAVAAGIRRIKAKVG